MGRTGSGWGSVMFKCFQEEKKKPFLSYIEKFVLPECQKGNVRFFDDAQRVFIFLSDKQIQIAIAAANEKLLQDISVKRLLWLSENFRTWHDDYYAYVYGDTWNCKQNINVSRKKFRHLTDSQYHATLKLGTFSSNGYYRQECMERLSDAEGSLPFLILRMNDWVAQIREDAYKLSLKRLQKCGLHEFFQSLPMLAKVKNAQRRDSAHISFLESQAEKLIRQKLQTQHDETLDQIPSYEIGIKNAVYRFMNGNPVLNREQMERLLARERTGYGQKLLILGIFHHYGYDKGKAVQYLHAKSAVVRYYMLVFRYEQEYGAWDGLCEMLTDPSRRIRDYAAYILNKHTDINVIAFYRSELDRHASKIALSGIGENGTKAEMEIIIPYLEEERESICTAALDAYGKLAQTDGEEIYWRFLFDERPVLARMAYRCIRKYGVQYGAARLYEAYLQNRSEFLDDYLLTLLLNEPFWKRLPYLLTLIGGDALTETQRQKTIAEISREYLYGCPSDASCNFMYSSVSKQQADWICSLLKQNEDHISESVRKRILFDLKHITRE